MACCALWPCCVGGVAVVTHVHACLLVYVGAHVCAAARVRLGLELRLSYGCSIVAKEAASGRLSLPYGRATAASCSHGLFASCCAPLSSSCSHAVPHAHTRQPQAHTSVSHSHARRRLMCPPSCLRESPLSQWTQTIRAPASGPSLHARARTLPSTWSAHAHARTRAGTHAPLTGQSPPPCAPYTAAPTQ